MSLVSIIMPAYNAEGYIAQAIKSVLAQAYDNWELLIVNDGSKDQTATVAQSFAAQDARIYYFEQKNKGASAARNLAFEQMKGDFICFLDADDELPTKAITSRLAVFEQNKDIEFVDGAIQYMDGNLEKILEQRSQTFEGQPLSALARLDSNCFFGLSWMIKVQPNKKYRFREGLSHSEDLLFYLSIAETGLYSYTTELVLHYRISGSSAMSNLEGLENGYVEVFRTVQKHTKINSKDKRYLRFRIMRIMFLSYLRNKQPFKAIGTGFKFLFLV